MPASLKLAAFAAVLAVIFAASALAGDLVGPAPAGTVAAPHAGEPPHATGTGDHGAGTARAVRGLGVAEGGLRLVVDEPELRRGRARTVAFRVVDDSGATVRDFDVEHERRMHLIVARRDLTGFQHLHPRQRADGPWSVRLRLDEAGTYRLLADFARDGESHTLATDLRVDGAADLRPLPPPGATAAAGGGYEVRLAGGRVRPGHEARLRFAITRDGEPIATQPYLGAGGHLVALREGDLAFLHVHPTERGAEDGIGFAATFPTAGRYRLFLQFRHGGRVRTAAFTQEAR